MRHLDLFTGIGGFALAAQTVWGKDYEPIVFCEIDKFCQKVLRKHWPNVEIINDVKNITENHWGEIELITGGFPCQDLSIAGGRSGLTGKQSGLWFEMARIIKMVKPKWVIIENVCGLLSSRNGKDMAEILNTLSEIGYCVAWRVLNAQYFGVAQRRKRVFIVGSLGNTDSVQVLFEPKSSYRNDKKKSEMGQRGLCISTRDGERQDPTGKTIIASTIRSNDHDTAGNTKPNNIIAGTITAKSYGEKGWPLSNEWNTIIANAVHNYPEEKMPPSQNRKNNLVAQTIGSTTKGASFFIWQDTHIAEINPSRKRTIDGISRKLDNVRGRSLGNAIVPQVAIAIMKGIKEFD